MRLKREKYTVYCVRSISVECVFFFNFLFYKFVPETLFVAPKALLYFLLFFIFHQLRPSSLLLRGSFSGGKRKTRGEEGENKINEKRGRGGRREAPARFRFDSLQAPRAYFSLLPVPLPIFQPVRNTKETFAEERVAPQNRRLLSMRFCFINFLLWWFLFFLGPVYFSTVSVRAFLFSFRRFWFSFVSNSRKSVCLQTTEL